MFHKIYVEQCEKFGLWNGDLGKHFQIERFYVSGNFDITDLLFSLPDYVGFIKKIMKLMQQDYPMIAKIEVELTQEKEMDHLPNRPSKFSNIFFYFSIMRINGSNFDICRKKILQFKMVIKFYLKGLPLNGDTHLGIN
jgi:hypothetical protein